SHEHVELGFLRKYIFSTDHKIIGIQFLFSGIIFLLIGGSLAMFFRLQLAWPQAELPILGKLFFSGAAAHKMPPEIYNILVAMHASIMILLVIIPLLAAAFANFTIP